MQWWKKAGLVLLAAGLAPEALSFCGFYVAQADTKLFNESSKVVLARKGDQTTITMANDFKGDVKEFAIVIPVPTVLKKDDIKVAMSQTIDRIDAYTAPRLVEYWDPDPCPEPRQYNYYDYPMAAMAMEDAGGMPMPKSAPRRDYGVKIEAQYDVGEYDILILSAKESTGLEQWLKDNDYRIPEGASSVLGSYIKQDMKFFVAKVDLDEHAKLETPYLRPLQVTYTSPKFMLPIRLGTVNANGPQELFIFALTDKGRVETTNYRTTKIPTDLEVPEYVQQEFGPFYKSMFDRQVAKHDMTSVFLEYAWPLTVICDPCSAEQLSAQELHNLGASWATQTHGSISGGFVTRLHVRYDAAHFPEDLVFQETADSSTFQGRYIINHPFMGDTTCDAGREYEKQLAARQQREVTNTSTLTGWVPAEIKKKIPARPNPIEPPKPKSWWEQQ